MSELQPGADDTAPFVIIPSGVHMVEFPMPRAGDGGGVVWDAPGLGAVLLTVYGGALVAADALAATGAIKPRTPIARVPLLWHLWVWDMSFLIWGLLFASAAWYFTRRDRGNGLLSVSL